MDSTPVALEYSRRAPYHYKIQRRIGYVLFGACAVAAALQVLRILSFPPPLSQYLTLSRESVQNVLFDLLLAVIALITSRIDRPVFRFMQVMAFALTGLLATGLTVRPFDATGVAILTYAILLAFQYSFFERHFVVKCVIGAVLVFGALLTSTVVRGQTDLLGSIAGVGAAAAYLLLIWILFAETLKEYAERARLMELELRKESVFVRFGKNVAGLVHNLRNLLTVLYGLNELLRRQVGGADEAGIVGRQQAAYDRMRQMLERILAVVRAKQDTTIRAVDLNEILEGIGDFFTTDPEFKRRVRLVYHLAEGRPRVEAQPLELCEVAENLIKNSWDSLGQQDPSTTAEIAISTFDGASTGFRIRDNGPGISGLTACEDEACHRHFAVGRTTKEHGTGLGVPFVLEAVRSNGWHIRIQSRQDQGTTTTIAIRGPLPGDET